VIVAGTQPADKNPGALSLLNGRSNLLLRVVSSLILAPLAIAAAYFGGAVFLAFWMLAALVVLWEWDTLVCAHDRNSVLTIGAASLIGAGLLLAVNRTGIALALICLGGLGVAALASRIRRLWCAGGLLYAAALLLAPVTLRSDPSHGFAAIMFVFVIVWLTDITAYFVGRAIGGPKLMPRVSPNKTWSGAIGGTVAGVAGGLFVASQFPSRGWTALALVALALSVASQIGDLAESAIKRQFSAKDASQLIPGHGGLMDRLDGFLTASIMAAIIGLAHGGLGASSRGLMVW
jgi:phosphatidate cytidylyltransferase